MNSQPNNVNRSQPPDSIDRPARAGMQRVTLGNASHASCAHLRGRRARRSWAATHWLSVRTCSGRWSPKYPAPRLRVVHLLVHALTEYSNRKKGSNIRQKKRFANIRLIRFSLKFKYITSLGLEIIGFYTSHTTLGLRPRVVCSV